MEPPFSILTVFRIDPLNITCLTKLYLAMWVTTKIKPYRRKWLNVSSRQFHTCLLPHKCSCIPWTTWCLPRVWYSPAIYYSLIVPCIWEEFQSLNTTVCCLVLLTQQNPATSTWVQLIRQRLKPVFANPSSNTSVVHSQKKIEQTENTVFFTQFIF